MKFISCLLFSLIFTLTIGYAQNTPSKGQTEMAKPGLKPIPGIVESAPLALTKADLETRRAELIKARDEMAANLQALSGAIQQVELFIKSLADRESLTRKAEEEKQNANPVPTVK